MKNSKYINQPKLRQDNIEREQYKVARSFILKNRINLKGKNILDFGAGNGEFSKYLHSREALVDCQETNKESQKEIIGKGLRLVGSIPKNKYDLIVSLEVIEHFVDPLEMVNILKKSLKPRGKIILTTPDHLYWKLRIKYFLGDISAFEYPNKHFSFFTKSSLRKLLNKYFKEIRSENIGTKTVYYGELK
jgi:2-polyprenyl-3-methyl-5-hydroxy-6-metoxy-1,4-benzoquinol methylase